MRVLHVTIILLLSRLLVWLSWRLPGRLSAVPGDYVTQGSNDHTIHEPESQGVCQESEQSANHGYFLLTGL